ncbi:hypothetical protein T484DRAFT_2539716 [Baffinella frigidus]|nr:hypothetical protein T484DRAFT_2539716 [Cryptophyta sp. CCMP2293]
MRWKWMTAVAPERRREEEDVEREREREREDAGGRLAMVRANGRRRLERRGAGEEGGGGRGGGDGGTFGGDGEERRGGEERRRGEGRGEAARGRRRRRWIKWRLWLPIVGSGRPSAAHPPCESVSLSWKLRARSPGMCRRVESKRPPRESGDCARSGGRSRAELGRGGPSRGCAHGLGRDGRSRELAGREGHRELHGLGRRGAGAGERVGIPGEGGGEGSVGVGGRREGRARLRGRGGGDRVELEVRGVEDRLPARELEREGPGGLHREELGGREALDLDDDEVRGEALCGGVEVGEEGVVERVELELAAHEHPPVLELHLAHVDRVHLARLIRAQDRRGVGQAPRAHRACGRVLEAEAQRLLAVGHLAVGGLAPRERRVLREPGRVGVRAAHAAPAVVARGVRDLHVVVLFDFFPIAAGGALLILDGNRESVGVHRGAGEEPGQHLHVADVGERVGGSREAAALLDERLHGRRGA